MQTRSTLPRALIAVIGAALTVITTPALAGRYDAGATAPSEVITARVIGFMCAGSLEANDIYDLDLYLAWKRLAEAKIGGSTSRKEWLLYPDMELEVTETYRMPAKCTPDATAAAHATVARVRRDLTNACAMDGCFDP